MRLAPGGAPPPPPPGFINKQLWLTMFGGYEQYTIDSMVYCLAASFLGNIRCRYA